MWDERVTQHAATHDYVGHRRELHRVLISSETAPQSMLQSINSKKW